MSEQLTFELPQRDALGRDAFFVAPSNAIAVAMLDQSDEWPNGKLLLLGSSGSGKTHLAHVWASERRAVIMSVNDVLDADIESALAQDALVIEDLHLIDQHPYQAQLETALFHIHNMALADAKPLLLTAQTPPRDWGLTLPDLLSRMQATTATKIDAPDDQLLGALLVKQFEDRQLSVTEPVVSYLIKRIERSSQAARDVVSQLDQASLRLAKPITRNFAAQILADNT